MIRIITPKREKIRISKGKKVFYRILPEEKTIKDFNPSRETIITTTQIIKTKNSIFVEQQEDIIKSILNLYSKKIKIKEVIFDYDNPKVNAHSFLREVYIKQNLAMLRTINIVILNYKPGKVIEKIKVIGINGSPRKNGDTKRILSEEIEKYWTGPYYQSEIIDLDSISECLACGGHQKLCKPGCIINDQMSGIMPKVNQADVLLIGSPVYMDLPTSRTIAFLSRLTEQTKHNRFAYIGKYAAALSSGYCSGTKAVISSLTNALEMLGFDIQGRSSREYIELWPDSKTRGGVPNEFVWAE